MAGAHWGLTLHKIVVTMYLQLSTPVLFDTVSVENLTNPQQHKHRTPNHHTLAKITTVNQ